MTIGDIVDSLSIANIRLWHIEDERREMAALLRDGGPGSVGADRMLALMNSVSAVNKERNSLIDQINAALAVLIDAARGDASVFQLRKEELLGTGKNKFYATETNSEEPT